MHIELNVTDIRSIVFQIKTLNKWKHRPKPFFFCFVYIILHLNLSAFHKLRPLKMSPVYRFFGLHS